MAATISCHELEDLAKSDGLFAVFDVRERGEYNECQIANSTSLPRSQIELRVGALVPNRKVPIVVYDEGGRRAELAANTLMELGYGEVAVLQGGLDAWRRENRDAVSGVNVPSKAFGEKVHHDRQVPDITPEELKALQDRGEDLVIFDVRTPEEYGRFCIPGGQNVPGGDLILWAEELRQKPAVIVNCAGRTRSIIAAAALRRLGLANVRALRNGTMGWLLAGLQLESKPTRSGPVAQPASRAQALAAALQIAREEKLEFISPEKLRETMQSSEAKYIIDVRGEGEYANGHIAGSIIAPGGQAVQRADDFVAIRNAQIVFLSNDSARAVMAAYWYRQMGFPKVAVLEGGLNAWKAHGHSLEAGVGRSTPLGLDAAKALVQLIDSVGLQQQIEKKSAVVLDVGSSLDFEAAHIPGAKWIPRGWLDIKSPELFPDRAQTIVLSCPDGMQSVFAARSLTQAGYKNVSVLAGGVSAWKAAGFATAQGLDDTLCDPNDVVLSPSIRGSKEDMQNYLNWELTLKH